MTREVNLEAIMPLSEYLSNTLNRLHDVAVYRYGPTSDDKTTGLVYLLENDKINEEQSLVLRQSLSELQDELKQILHDVKTVKNYVEERIDE